MILPKRAPFWKPFANSVCKLYPKSIYTIHSLFTPTVHAPVLLEETLVLLAPRSSGKYLDCTFGGGGHTTAILTRTAGAHVTALDQDPEAVDRAAEITSRFQKCFSFYPINFRHLDRVPGSFDGVLMDIGVSSHQLDTPGRGFSFRNDGPADMRMDTTSGRSAAEFLESASREEIEEAIRDYGEEPRWRRVVGAILAARGTGKLSRTASLAELIAQAAPPPPGPRGNHPATRSFQGIRIAVNDELGALEEALPKAFAALSTGGVLAVIAFHSLEDRIVKRYFNEMSGRPVDRDDSRTQDQRVVQAELLTRKPISATEAETQINPRSRSARLRAIRRLTR